MEMDNAQYPSSLMEAIETFSDPVICLDAFAMAKRGSEGPARPECAGKRLSFLQTRLMWRCLNCNKKFSVKVGTIFEDSPIPLNKRPFSMWNSPTAKAGSVPTRSRRT